MEKNTNLDLFKEGCIILFKRWSSFRIALDNNPEVLSNYSDDTETQLEINDMLDTLFYDIYIEIQKETGRILEQNVADILFCFIQEFFDADLDDESDQQVAMCLIKLGSELKEGKIDYLNKLKEQILKFKINFAIEFPILNIAKLNKEFGEKININGKDNMVIDDHKNIPDEEGFIEMKKGKKF